MGTSRIASWTAILRKVKVKKEKLQRQVSQLEIEISALDRKAQDLQQKLEDLNNQDIKVSPHAFIRFRERIDSGLTDYEIEKLLVTDELKYQVGVCGNGKYPCLEGTHTAVIADRFIVTIY